MKRKFLFLTMLLTLCAVGTMKAQNSITTVTTETELIAAVQTNNAQIQFANDISTSSLLEIKNSRKITIDMNGFTLDRGCTSRGSQVIVVRTGSTLNLSNGTLTGGWGGNGGALDIEPGTTVNLTDVIITGNTADDRGGGIANRGTLTMTGGAITGNTSRDNVGNEGGGGLINYIDLTNGTATLTNVTISDNKATYGGGLCNRGTLVMEGCTISDNFADYIGGGISNEGILTMTDCAVSSNKCFNLSLPTRGNGIYNQGTLNLQGNVQIKDNNDNDDDDGDDIYLPTGSKITVTGTLTGGSGSIGVRMQSPGVFTIGYQSHNSQTDHFFSNIVPNDIVLVDGEAKMRYGYYECSWDSENKQVVHTAKTIPDNVQIANVCDIEGSTEDYVLSGNDYWFIAEGTGATPLCGLTCSGSNVHLILCDDAEYRIYGGFFVNEHTTLHVYSQSYGDRMGKLICIGDNSQPGIGPKHDDSFAGNIDIHGGDIRATGGDYGAGIGGCEDRSSGTITIWDGKIEATGGTDAAGIGGGEGGSGTYTYIYGGNIKATGGDYGAGIGGGENSGGGGNGGHIEIFDGTIVASGTGTDGLGGGAGIGSGDHGDQSSPIIIHGGVVTATGGYLSAGIGSGNGGDAYSITINDGIVMANGSCYGAAIGGGCAALVTGSLYYGGYARHITINGGFVSAYTHFSSISTAAAIGGGKDGKGNIDINGGIVFACSDDGAAIGSGSYGPRSYITINGGSVVALSLVGGAGIGSGKECRKDENGYIRITGGEVMAMGGAHKHLVSHGSPYSANKFIAYISKFLLLLRGSRPNAGIIDMLTTSVVQVLQALSDITEEEKYGGAGIGGGYGEENSDKWNITIEGGYVVAHAGRSEAEAIGHGYDSDDGSGTLTISQGIMVSAGSDENHYTPQTAANRVSACRDNQYVYLQPCGHKDADSYTDNGDGTYTINEESCIYCGIAGEQICHHTFTDDGDWNNANNWNSGHVPNDGNDVVICAHCEIPGDYVAKADTIIVPYYDTIFIKDGGQLFHSNAGVTATVQKAITGHGGNNENGWNFIASPMVTNIIPTVDNGFLSETAENYDLYYYDEPAHYWRNFKPDGLYHGFDIEPQKGYLYASQDNTTLIMTGTLKASNESDTIKGLSHSATELTGFNLVGNPFACNATIDRPFYVIEGKYVVAYEGNEPIAPATGVMVQADADHESVTFTKVTPEAQASQSNSGSLQIALMQANTRNHAKIDKAIVSFNESDKLEKFHFADNAKIYIPQGGKDYAIASVSAGRDGVHTVSTTEVPINFKATENGNYTITVNPKGVDLAYLHLIDNMTGADVDLLQTPYYTFTAKTNDYESRFKLVFATDDEDGTLTDTGTFAFNSNGNWIIANEGEAILQLIDINGRILSSETISGSVSKAIDVAPGVYLLKLNDKVQKIVVK